MHKLVLSACSEYFKDIFQRTPCKSPVVVLKDVRSQDIDALLDYMYIGEVNVQQKELDSLLKTAESLGIQSLKLPDENPLGSRKSRPYEGMEACSPPKKKRCTDKNTPPAPSKPARLVFPVASTSSKPNPLELSHPTQESSCSPFQNITPIVKVKVEDPDQPDSDFQVTSLLEDEARDFVADVVKFEHDLDNSNEPDDIYKQDRNYESSSLTEDKARDFGTDGQRVKLELGNCEVSIPQSLIRIGLL